MITVAIFINNEPIVLSSAVNKIETNDKGQTKYLTKTGKVVWHKRELGAIPLAKKLLDICSDEALSKFKE